MRGTLNLKDLYFVINLDEATLIKARVDGFGAIEGCYPGRGQPQRMKFRPLHLRAFSG